MELRARPFNFKEVLKAVICPYQTTLPNLLLFLFFTVLLPYVLIPIISNLIAGQSLLKIRPESNELLLSSFINCGTTFTLTWTLENSNIQKFLTRMTQLMLIIILSVTSLLFAANKYGAMTAQTGNNLSRDALNEEIQKQSEEDEETSKQQDKSEYRTPLGSTKNQPNEKILFWSSFVLFILTICLILFANAAVSDELTYIDDPNTNMDKNVVEIQKSASEVSKTSDEVEL
jgi:anaerobic C4-dicarboxylate transporter